MFKSVVVVVAKQAQSRPAVSRFEMQPRNLVLKGQGGVDRRDASDAGVGESGGGSKGSNDPKHSLGARFVGIMTAKSPTSLI